MSIAIVGGGFSGICTAIHLIDRASSPFALHIIEKNPEPCKGIAYATTSSFHPLNLRADQMGAYSGQGRHFYLWLQQQEIWRKLDPTFKDLEIKPESFLPRKLYAIYLLDMFEKARSYAIEKGIHCTVLRGEATDATLNGDGSLELVIGESRTLYVDKLILAQGMPPVRNFSFETPNLTVNSQYTKNLLRPRFESLLGSSGNSGKNSKIVIIGANLTSIDALYTLHSMGFKGTIQIISRNGYFPQVHNNQQQTDYPELEIENLPKNLRLLVHLFRNELKKTEDPETIWRQLIDAHRPRAVELWKSLPLDEKKRFMRHLFVIWNKHSTRISPQSQAIMDDCVKNNGLSITKAIVNDVSPLPNGKLQVRYTPKTGRGIVVAMEADHVINCSGPDYFISKHPDPLIKNLLRKDMVVADDLGLGLKVTQKQKLAGRNQDKIFAIGALLFGEYFQTVEVPELRHQADSIAKTILAEIHQPALVPTH